MNNQEIAQELRKAKSGLFAECGNMDKVLAYVEECFPAGPDRVAALTAVMMGYNTTLENIAKMIEGVQENEK